MADNSSIGMIRATQADISVLSGVLAQAFQQDPVFQWLVQDPETRRTTLPSLFAAFARVYVPHGESYLAGNATGAALWAPPGVDPFDDRTLEVFAREMTEILGSRVEQALELDQILREHHPTEACAFLQLIGVSPAGQGRGLGSRMLHAVLRRCDLRGTPAYLEATSIDNRRLYQRCGFEVVSEITIRGGPALWAMWRTPQALVQAPPSQHRGGQCDAPGLRGIGTRAPATIRRVEAASLERAERQTAIFAAQRE